MNLTDDQLLRIAKVIEAEPIFQFVFDNNLKGTVTDKEIMNHVIYFEDHGILYGYSGGKAKKTTMAEMYEGLKQRYGEGVKFKDDTGLKIEKLYGVPLIRSGSKKRSKKKITSTRKSRLTRPTPTGGISAPNPLASSKQINLWLKDKLTYLSSQDRHHDVDGLDRVQNTYKFPDGTTVIESELCGSVVSQRVERPRMESYGYPFYVGT